MSSSSFDFQQELFDVPCKDFMEHIQVPGNNRILFSGKFGIGKSYFLDHFFDNKIQVTTLSDVKYSAFHIYPVNYSIASNEDIFRYIKYDVITTMLSKGIELEENDLRYLDTLPDYLKGNLLKVVATLIFMIPKIGKSVYDSHEKIEELKEHFRKHHNSINESEGDALIKYLEKIENKEGSLFENNIITKLINNILVRISKANNKENVLIIDDLDRIDPEHIFRLLNVFAAHLDNSEGQPNKLGFDKIILVCDVKNLKNIFKSKYGIETDFNGYIDKFYSADIYHFDNRSVLKGLTNNVFRNIDLKGVDTREIGVIKSKLFKGESVAFDICQMLISNGLISLRSIVNRFAVKTAIDINRHLVFDDQTLVTYLKVPLFAHFRILKGLVGDYETLKDYLQRIPTRAYVISNLNLFSNVFLYFVNYEKTFRTQGTVSVTLNNKELRFTVKDTIDKLDELLVYEGLNFTTGPQQYNFSLKEFQMLLLDFIDLLIRLDN